MAKIDDVAKLAKVSKGTVSNVFSQKRPTSNDVKERVLSVSKQLNYVPNHIARSLVTKKTMAIGLTIPHGSFFFSAFHTQFINGVILEASYYGYRVLLDMIPLQKVHTPFLSSYPIDGAVIMRPTTDDERINLMYTEQIPFVTVGRVMNSTVHNAYCVDNDNYAIIYNICKYLIDKGHQNIMFLNANELMTVSIGRKEGFIKAMEDHHLQVEEHMIHHKPDLSSNEYLEYGYEETMAILGEQKKGVTAIIADDDRTAFSALNAIKDLNLRVPENVSIFVICGDLSMMVQSNPPLTSMDLQPSELGAQSVRLLMSQLGVLQGDIPRNVIIQSKIIERNSCSTIGQAR
ncbi:LacI family DNA-binding transcriptional regulator [Paenibacillus aceris]|uniref:DNA-binding LacI/PurR family transcriptional regulator n=1 Tax=Paenibacillus aceris TaxID=869555 RepID=A0ABS4I6G4_9BACL|nr:LacI family DNA-binding transcriptional regulator [Paenibacillus aceris]MBP1966490.1 DNA-binding LacI/PurR family transcriptional regulator [Paenibacillus aceris]NHW39533.1 LacI family transcriptional regulator [Paenibacillus aceris]